MNNDYAGFVTRAIAFAIDVVVVDLAAGITAVVVGLGLSALDVPDAVVTVAVAVGAFAFVVWSIGYFTTFWATTGQTPGARVMGIQVIDAGGRERLPPRRAVLRVIGMLLAAIPLCAGFLLILVDDRRRGLQDYLAHTVVIYVPASSRLD